MQSKEQKLKEFAMIRDYVIDVIATAVAAGTDNTLPNAAAIERLAAKEKAVFDIIERQ